MPSCLDHTPIPAGFKRCSKCGGLKPATTEYFRADPRVKSGLRADCKVCEKLYARQHCEQINARVRQWQLDHPEQTKETKHQWYTQHPERAKTYKRDRRARKKGAEGTHTSTDCLTQYKRQHGKCYYCGHKMKPWGWKESCDLQPTEEHVIPLSRGGSNGPDNLVIACRKCNAQKYTKLPYEWPEGGRLL